MPKTSGVFIILILISGCFLAGPKTGWLTGYEYRSQALVELTDTATAVKDLQVLVEIQGADTKKPRRVDFSRIKPDGADVCFTDSNGLRKIPFWIQSWDNENKTALVWVKIPDLVSGQNKLLYLYYGAIQPHNLTSYDSTMQKLTADASTRALWHFDESGKKIKDAGKFKNHSHFFAAARTKQDGGQWANLDNIHFADGNALEFNGANHYVEIPSSDGLNLAGQTELSLEAWVYPKKFVPHGTVLAKRGQYYLQVHQDGRVACYLVGPKPENYYYSQNPVPLNQWSFLVVTYNGQELKFYLNGQLDQTIPIIGAITSFIDKIKGIDYQNHPLRVGDDATGQNRYWTGLIDEIRILNRVLSDGEIKADYERRRFTEGKINVWVGPEEKQTKD